MDFIEGIITWGFILLIALIVWAAIATPNMQNTAPCSEFAGWTLKNVPARCVEFFKAEE